MLPGWGFCLMLVYGTPCYILYFLVVYHFVHPKFRKTFFVGAFFRISTCIGVLDLVEYLVSFPMTKMPLCPFFAGFYGSVKPGYWINVLMFVSYYTTYSRQCFLVANAFNRFTAIRFPNKHGIYWSYLLKPVLILCLLLGLPGSYHHLLSVPSIIRFYVGRNDTYVLVNKFKLYNVDAALNGALQATTTGAVALIFNVCTLCMLKTKLKSNQKRVSRTETGLFCIALWDFLLQFLWVIHQLWCYTFVLTRDVYNPIFDALYLVVPWYLDLVVLSQPFVILIFCKKSRIIFTKNAKKTNIVVMSSAVQLEQIQSSQFNSVQMSVSILSDKPK